MSVATTQHDSVTAEPAGLQWEAMARRWKRPSAAASFRKELGLAVDGPIVLTGHQAEFWHAGILAKYLAAQALADVLASDGSAVATAWLVVDQDSNEPSVVRYPARRDGRLVTGQWKLGEPLGTTMDVPTGCRPPLAAGPLVLPAATGAVAAGIERMRGALSQASCATAAGQLACAIKTLTKDLVPAGVPVFASRVTATTLGAEIVEKILRDPERCARTYNEAAASVPEAGLKPLNVARGELPLWHLRAGEPRKRVHASQLGSIPREQLAPRALLTTGIIRYAACDFMIHGTGGGVYDLATERWMEEWLGWELAPDAVATATWLVGLTNEPVVRVEDAAKEIWRAHHARHDPGMLGDEWAAQRKRDLLDEIRDAKRKRQSPDPYFDQMHRLLGQMRMESATAIAELDQKAKTMRQRLSDASVVFDRTWAFALHEPARLEALKAAVYAEFGR